jgi:phage shock protein A
MKAPDPLSNDKVDQFEKMSKEDLKESLVLLRQGYRVLMKATLKRVDKITELKEDVEALKQQNDDAYWELKDENDDLKQQIEDLKHENKMLIQKWSESNRIWNTQTAMISNQYMVNCVASPAKYAYMGYTQLDKAY